MVAFAFDTHKAGRADSGLATEADLALVKSELERGIAELEFAVLLSVFGAAGLVLAGLKPMEFAGV